MRRLVVNQNKGANIHEYITGKPDLVNYTLPYIAM